MNKNVTVNAMIQASDKDTRSYYHQAIKNLSFIERIDQACDLNEMVLLKNSCDYRYLFVGEIENLTSLLAECKCQILENMPSTRIVLLGLQWSNSEDGHLIYPIRGVIDLRLQSPREIQRSLKLIHKRGFDFALVINHYPEIRRNIKEYATKMPINDPRFLEFLPLLGLKSNMALFSKALGVSERTLRNLREKWRTELNLADDRAMYLYALELGWTTPQATHAAGQRLTLLMEKLGSYG